MRGLPEPPAFKTDGALLEHARHKSPAMVAVYVREAEKWTKSGLKGIGF
jgi:hypothetical protein